eukprot:1135205-Prorocentrum_minimum.AAC.2
MELQNAKDVLKSRARSTTQFTASLSCVHTLCQPKRTCRNVAVALGLHLASAATLITYPVFHIVRVRAEVDCYLILCTPVHY